ncbi:Arrestin-like 7 [Homarus americanus]|uniref:Arrestin-like 7 n=1 Tax=Homarus americanus TaxID=6706 RepID=A0A8J5NA09_HOMAM|nr:Arrestin-like 7 [Homarus americanus]
MVLTLYLTKRDYFDHVTHVDPIEGVLVLDPNYVSDRNVYVQIVLTFRFGREEDESMGYNFVKTMYLGTTQLYPPVTCFPPSEIQRNLISKLGNFAFPFMLEFPKLSTPSYTMMQGWEEEGRLIGVEFEVMGFVGVNEQDCHKRSSCRLTVRRLMECPARLFDAPAPRGNITKTFLTCSGSVTLEASLTSNVYFPEEEIPVQVTIKNNTTRELKKLKVKIVQMSEVPIFSKQQVRDKTLMKIDNNINLPAGADTSKNYTLIPAVPSRMARGQVFLQSELQGNTSPSLAPSTILNPEVDKRDLFGVHVTYAVRIKVPLGTLIGDTILDVPFILAVQQGQ